MGPNFGGANPPAGQDASILSLNFHNPSLSFSDNVIT
jgi:hypothetical protein